MYEKSYADNPPQYHFSDEQHKLLSLVVSDPFNNREHTFISTFERIKKIIGNDCKSENLTDYPKLYTIVKYIEENF